jgi:hypothetical protein
VTGTLRDEKGNPVPTASALLFPEDPSQWPEDLRLARVGRMNQSGLFTIKAVRPGEYLAIALPSVTAAQWIDPDFLNTLRSDAKRVTVQENTPVSLQLVVKVPGGQ